MDKNREIIRAVTDVEYYQLSELEKRSINIDRARKFPIEQAVALGVAFQPLVQLASYATGGPGKSGLYYVNTAGKTMFQSSGQYIGNLQAANGGVGGGLARMTQIPVDPTMLCMAVAIMSIEKKLNDIQEIQKEILAFLEMQEEAKLKGNLNTLLDVLTNYKFNWDNEKYKDHKHILVQDIKREVEQSIILHREMLTKSLNKNTLLHSDQKTKSTLNKITKELNNYQLALYEFSFSSFLEVMLLENFDPNYLKSVVEKIKKYSLTYTTFYKKCSEKIGNDSKSSLEGFALVGLSKLTGGAGRLAEKIPVINKSQLDESLIKAGTLLQDKNMNRTESMIQLLADNKTDYCSTFVENIQIVDSLYNQQSKLMFDDEHIYIMN